jgi:CubicO group peptidase (beta-lactamase class C family)
LEKQIPELMEQAVVPGFSIALIADAKLVWRRGFGVKNSVSKEPVDNDTVFEAASTSKPVFAYAVTKLCEKGVLDLDTPLTHYTPDRFPSALARSFPPLLVRNTPPYSVVRDRRS